MVKLNIDGQYYFFKGGKDVSQFVSDVYGSDLGAYIDGLSTEGMAIKYKLDSDMESYESTLDSHNSAFIEILNVVEQLQEEMKVKTCKRDIKEVLDYILKLVENEI